MPKRPPTWTTSAGEASGGLGWGLTVFPRNWGTSQIILEIVIELHFRAGYRATRVGEASHPGPFDPTFEILGSYATYVQVPDYGPDHADDMPAAPPTVGEPLGGALGELGMLFDCLLYTSPSPRDQRGSRMPSSA